VHGLRMWPSYFGRLTWMGERKQSPVWASRNDCKKIARSRAPADRKVVNGPDYSWCGELSYQEGVTVFSLL
jgi:hypothetical protein